MKSEMDPRVIREIDRQIDAFLDDFMLEEYKGGQHIVAKQSFPRASPQIFSANGAYRL